MGTMRLWTAIFALLLIFLLPFVQFAATKPADRPNIIFILTDDQDSTLGSLDYMPKLNALLTQNGITFSNFFVTYSLCCPSRASILRGQYPHNTQVVGNEPPLGGFLKFHQLGLENSTIATWLHDEGYRTGLLGKYVNGYPSRSNQAYVPPGWDEWYSSTRGDAYSEYNYQLNENGKLVPYGKLPEDYLTDVLGRKAMDFIQRAPSFGQPFFVFLATFAPHQPATPAPPSPPSP